MKNTPTANASAPSSLSDTVDEGISTQGDMVTLIPALRAFARSLCRNHPDADDLVQETLTKGLSNVDRFEPGTNLKSWLFTIMRNSFYTNVKRRNREQPGSADCVASECTTAATQEWSLRAKELHAALEKIPADHREVLILIGVLGMSYEEAAEICQCAMGTIKSRLSRARSRMLELLDPADEDARPTGRFAHSRSMNLPMPSKKKMPAAYFQTGNSMHALSNFLNHGSYLG